MGLTTHVRESLKQEIKGLVVDKEFEQTFQTFKTAATTRRSNTDFTKSVPPKWIYVGKRDKAKRKEEVQTSLQSSEEDNAAASIVQKSARGWLGRKKTQRIKLHRLLKQYWSLCPETLTPTEVRRLFTKKEGTEEKFDEGIYEVELSWKNFSQESIFPTVPKDMHCTSTCKGRDCYCKAMQTYVKELTAVGQLSVVLEAHQSAKGLMRRRWTKKECTGPEEGHTRGKPGEPTQAWPTKEDVMDVRVPSTHRIDWCCTGGGFIKGGMHLVKDKTLVRPINPSKTFKRLACHKRKESRIKRATWAEAYQQCALKRRTCHSEEDWQHAEYLRFLKTNQRYTHTCNAYKAEHERTKGDAILKKLIDTSKNRPFQLKVFYAAAGILIKVLKTIGLSGVSLTMLYVTWIAFRIDLFFAWISMGLWCCTGYCFALTRTYYKLLKRALNATVQVWIKNLAKESPVGSLLKLLQTRKDLFPLHPITCHLQTNIRLKNVTVRAMFSEVLLEEEEKNKNIGRLKVKLDGRVSRGDHLRPWEAWGPFPKQKPLGHYNTKDAAWKAIKKEMEQKNSPEESYWAEYITRKYDSNTINDLVVVVEGDVVDVDDPTRSYSRVSGTSTEWTMRLSAKKGRRVHIVLPRAALVDAKRRSSALNVQLKRLPPREAEAYNESESESGSERESESESGSASESSEKGERLQAPRPRPGRPPPPPPPPQLERTKTRRII